MCGRYNRDHNDNVTEETFKTWDASRYVKCGDAIYDYLEDPTLYDEVKPVIGALNGVESLRTLGYRVIFITYSTQGHSGRKFQWLKDNGFIKDNSLQDYYEAKDKSLIACDYLIDDNPDNAIKAYGKGYLFTRAWNKNVNHPRFDNWDEITRFFIGLSNYERYAEQELGIWHR